MRTAVAHIRPPGRNIWSMIRVARTGLVLGTGATVGGVSYVNYKFGQLGAGTQEKISQFSDKLGSIWDNLSQGMQTFKTDSPYEGNSSSGSSGSGSGSGSGSESGSGSGPGSGNSGPGGPGGPGAPALGAIAALASDDDMDHMVNLTRRMIEIRNILLQIDSSDSLTIPSIVVIGSQSSGKSSVLEAVVGHEFLPKGQNMVTRRPIELTLVHSPGLSTEYCEFPELKMGKLTDFSIVQRTLFDLNKAVEEEIVSSDPIRLNVYSPQVPDLTMVDLPGYIQVVSADQPLDLKRRISDLCDKYIQEPNIILAISAADVDLANSTALRASRRVDPRGERTIGVITKIDLVTPDRGYEILTNRQYPLSMGYVGVVSNSNGVSNNLSKVIAQREATFFSQFHEYSDPRVDTGTVNLTRKLCTILEKTMAASLRPATRAIRRELEECSYQFKVEFNDRGLTPVTFLAQSVDSFKQAFKDLSNQFSRDEVKQAVRASIDQSVLDQLAERYWNSPNEHDPEPLVPLKALGSDKGSHEFAYWQNILDSCSSNLTKSGIGRKSALLLVDEIEDRMNKLVAHTSFSNHPLAQRAVIDATKRILDSRYFTTADQIENSIKPFKYEVDVDDREWASTRDYTYSLLKEELRQCNSKFEEIKAQVGSSKLQQVLKYIDSARATGHINELSFSPVVIDLGKHAAFLKVRSELLSMRMTAIKSSQCSNKKNRYYCPEVFMGVVAEKLTSTAALFLNFELLSDFYYTFPRELDNIFAEWTEQDIATFAAQDPRIQRQVDLQKRKDLLELALRKVEAIEELRR